MLGSWRHLSNNFYKLNKIIKWGEKINTKYIQNLFE